MTTLARLYRDDGGAAALEFGILAPAMLALLVGVLQVGAWMQAYNALRGVASETVRYTMVTYQKDAVLTDTQIETQAKAIGVHAPYLLTQSLTATSEVATTQRVTGATEKTLTLHYTIYSYLGMIGINNLPVTYQRSFFLPS